jgi:hypothetical protein
MVSPSPAKNLSISPRTFVALDLLASELGRELVHDAVEHLGGETGAAVEHLRDGQDQVLVRAAFDQVADRAGSEHLQDRGAVFERGERDHARVGRHSDDLPGSPRSAAGRHAHVDQCHIGLPRSGELDRLVRVAGLAYEH